MLQGREDLVTRLVDEKYDALLVKHAALSVDGRAETHLQVNPAFRLAFEQLPCQQQMGILCRWAGLPEFSVQYWLHGG